MAYANTLFSSSSLNPINRSSLSTFDSTAQIPPHVSSNSSWIRLNFPSRGMAINLSRNNNEAEKVMLRFGEDFFNSRFSRSKKANERSIWCASTNGASSVDSTSLKSELDDDYVPMPIVLIDQDSDSDATIVQLSFGDRLGALLDTIKSLKDLGLDVSKGTVVTEGSVKQTKFFITRLDTGRKVEDPDMLERIRLTIINNLLKYHPESSEQLAMGEAFGIKAPEKKLDVNIATHVHVKEDGPKRSLLCIETADRPGLLVEIIKIIADVNIDVESAEIETEGLVAKDKFHVSYRGAALNSSLSQVLVNCLRYYLRRPETDIDSY
ncbi:ACT domain-containing protein ACR12-like isoform X1 [Tripterygium wilfordii]|uniref:ACT domain-containing protein ACR12-like isoform X1 n=1 Tax=Tripterygium wilfordii TaxID=458696 RepID=UPI0018F7F171|nr:ACT domain-containing protein ACR12-like isoform X1 [Tripterygium wilfordii]